jgi:Uma2 family endonuclease
MSGAPRFVTAEELERCPKDDYRYELVEGRVVRMSPVGYQHGRVVMQLAYVLQRHLQGRDLGVVLTEVGFKLAANPDTVRAPDLAFVRRDRIPSPDPRGFFDGPPDLAVEVLSPEDQPSEIRAKVDEYLTRGVRLVLVVDPDDRTVTSHRRLTPPVVARGDDDLVELGEVVPDFRCALREIWSLVALGVSLGAFAVGRLGVSSLIPDL